jgi:hypothetical protein
VNDVELTGWFYLSFADETFRGGAIVQAPDDILAATLESHRLGINPGGQVIGMPIPVGFLPGPEYRERLLSKADINAFWPDAKRLGDIEDDPPN